MTRPDDRSPPPTERPFHVLSVHHVQLAMPPGGEETATAFYADLLGLERIAKPAALAGRGGCWFRGGTVELHLGVEADFRPARKAHPALRVDDLAAAAACLAAAGVDVRPDTAVDGHERVYVHDPFGNRLELLAPAADLDRD